MATVAQLLERIRRSFNGKFDDRTYFIDLMNDALNQLTDGAKLEGMVQLTFIASDGSASLPSTYKAPIALVDGEISESSQSYPLVNIDENRFGFATFGGKAYLKPKPDQDKTLNFYFYKYATPLVNDSDIPEIDAPYHDLLSTYAILMILLLPGNVEADKGMIDRLTAQWSQGLNSFRQSMMVKNKRSGVRTKEVW